MRVDPADSSYMPSLIVVNGGSSFNSLTEKLNIINVKSTDTLINLLTELDTVRSSTNKIYILLLIFIYISITLASKSLLNNVVMEESTAKFMDFQSLVVRLLQIMN